MSGSSVSGGATGAVVDPGASVGGSATGGAATPAGSSATGGGSTVAGGGNILDTGSTVTGAENKTAAWRDDWRDAMATVEGKADAKFRKELDRYATPEAYAQSVRALRTRLDAGELVAKLPKDAKPEEVAAWRKDQGIPEKADGYLENLPAGLVIGEKDKPLVGTIAEAMHAVNASPEVAQTAVQLYFRLQEQMATETIEANKRAQQATEDTLRVEWGQEYRANLNAISGFLDGQAGGAKEALLMARAADGTMLLNNPAVARFLVSMAKEMNPAAGIIPGTGGNAAKGIDDRIKEIEKTMGTPAYYKDEVVQAEYRTLIEARDRTKARAA